MKILKNNLHANERIKLRTFFNFHFNHSELYTKYRKKFEILKIWKLFTEYNELNSVKLLCLKENLKTICMEPLFTFSE